MIWNTNRSMIGGALIALVVMGIVGCGDDSTTTAPFTAKVIDFYAKTSVPGATVNVMDNDTGAPLGITQVSDATGRVAFSNLPTGKEFVAFKQDEISVHGIPYIDTMQFNIKTVVQNEELWLFDKNTFNTSVQNAGADKWTMFTADLQAGGYAVVGGRVYWVNAAGREEMVGCATVTITVGGSDASTNLAYSNANSIPVPYGAINPSNPSAMRDRTHPLSSDFSSVHIPPGAAVIEAFINGTSVGSTTVTFIAQVGGGKYSFLVANVYVNTSYTANPTPDDCI